MPSDPDRLPLGATGLQVSSVAMGCWPIAGMTTRGVTEERARATLQAAFDAGINFFDTAFAYGREGESERRIAGVLGTRRDEIVLATKAGIGFDAQGRQIRDASPATLRRQVETSLGRLATDRVDLLYLHAPDPQRPIEEAAATLLELMQEGKTRSVGVSNVTLEALQRFHAVCPVTAVQPPYNLLQRDIEADLLPWCREHTIAVCPYWPLLKGLLAGGMRRGHVFPEGDGRPKYPFFQGAEFEKNLDFVEALRGVAEAAGRTVSQVAINWILCQPGMTSALCGAHRPGQIRDCAGAMGWRLDAGQLEALSQALEKRGLPVMRTAVG